MSTTDPLNTIHIRRGDARGNAPRFCPLLQMVIEPGLRAYTVRLARAAIKAEGYHWCAKCAGWHK